MAAGRALWALVAVFSFGLFLLSIYLWARSYFIAEVVYFGPVAAPEEYAKPMIGRPNRWHYQYHVASSRGRAQIVRRNLGVGEEQMKKVWHLRPDDPGAITSLNVTVPSDASWKLAGFEYFRSQRRHINMPPVQAWVWGFHMVTVPYWFLVLVTAVPPAIVGQRFLRGRKRRRRLAAGLCIHCGYDLRASVGACPECGRENPGKHQEAASTVTIPANGAVHEHAQRK